MAVVEGWGRSSKVVSVDCDVSWSVAGDLVEVYVDVSFGACSVVCAVCTVGVVDLCSGIPEAEPVADDFDVSSCSGSSVCTEVMFVDVV